MPGASLLVGLLAQHTRGKIQLSNVSHFSFLAGASKDVGLPLKLFEISDVILLSPEKAVGAKNSRRLVAVHCDKTSAFEVIHGLLNRLMDMMRVPLLDGGDEVLQSRFGGGYDWRAEDTPTFFPGRRAASE